MEETELTFLSSRGTGLNADLKLVQSYLLKNIKNQELKFRFFLNSEKSNNDMVNQGVTSAKMKFCENVSSVISTDGSLSANVKKLNPAGVRLLLATPYDYQFKNMKYLDDEKDIAHKRKTFKHYTHIVSGSPFTSKMLSHFYDLDGKQVMKDFCLPFVWDINQTESQNEIRNALIRYFPAIEKKKIFSLLFYGEPKKRNRWIEDFDIKKLLGNLGEDWFIITNLQEIVDKIYFMKSKYKDSFGFVNHIMPSQNLLYVSEMLLTNNGRLASYFVSRGKRIYCPEFRGNFFENYMREKYHGMYLEKFSDLISLDLNADVKKDEQKMFHDQMTYKKLLCPYDYIARLFTRK